MNRLNNEIQSLSFVYLPDTQLEAAAVHYTAGRRPTCCIRHLVQEAEVLHTDCEAVDTDVVAAVVAALAPAVCSAMASSMRGSAQ